MCLVIAEPRRIWLHGPALLQKQEARFLGWHLDNKRLRLVQSGA